MFLGFFWGGGGYMGQMYSIWVKDVKMSASKEMYKSDFMSIERTLNVSKVSTFKVSNKFFGE